MISLPHLFARVFNEPLLISEAKLSAIMAVVGPRLGVAEMIPAANTSPLLTHRRDRLSASTDGIAVIPIIGTLVKRGAYMNAESGLTSYDAWTHAGGNQSATTSAIGIGTSLALYRTAYQ